MARATAAKEMDNERERAMMTCKGASDGDATRSVRLCRDGQYRCLCGDVLEPCSCQYATEGLLSRHVALVHGFVPSAKLRELRGCGASQIAGGFKRFSA